MLGLCKSGVVLKLQLLPPLTYRPSSSPTRKIERPLLVTGELLELLLYMLDFSLLI